MSTATRKILLSSPEKTSEFAARVGEILFSGDTLLLAGEIGAGKTHFARGLIQSVLDAPEDVPSPTFTLVQTYETSKGIIHHADLYRVSGPQDVVELGLLEAFGTDICLIEWPDRLGDDAPKDAMTLTFDAHDEANARLVSVEGQNLNFFGRLAEVWDD